MLNELLFVERGARQAGLEMPPRHPDVKDARSMPTLLVQLGEQGHVTSIRPVHKDLTLWTLRDGQHNSFPFVQPKPALLDIPCDDERCQTVNNRKSSDRRATLLAFLDNTPLNAAAFDGWPGVGLLNRLRERRTQTDALVSTKAAALPAAIDRFLLACDAGRENAPIELLREVLDRLRVELERTADGHWLDVAAALLVGKKEAKTGGLKSEGAFIFDAHGDWRSVSDPGLIGPISAALRAHESKAGHARSGYCGLSGEAGPLVESEFPQPNLPVLGQTYLFARNRDTPANGRYGRSSADTMPVGKETAIQLAAAAEALTGDDRKGKTWRAIPGETPRQSDLLLAFVDALPDAPVADALAEDDAEGDYSTDDTDSVSDPAGSIAAFEKRTTRVIEAIQATVKVDFTRIPLLRLAVLRKVDPANRKVVYAGDVPVKQYYRAAEDWARGERNVPPWLSVPVLHKGERKPRRTSMAHVAPLGVIAFSRQLFLRGGTERQEVVGFPASEAMGLFLQDDTRRVDRFLRMVISRRSALISGTSHALRRGIDAAREFDRREVLRTVTLLGVLLYKLDRRAGDTMGGYMNDTAFKLGQLLAATDVVHAGYCADVRGGDLPPSLLGNQVFAMAQTAPIKALATLCRRWRPYDGWAQKRAREADSVESLRNKEERRYWEVRKALRHAREMRPLASQIAPALAEARVDDVFRAELLLGYLAGFPKIQRDDAASVDDTPLDHS
jgi:hypothetical protein